MIYSGFVPVLENLEKSWNFIMAFSWTRKSWKMTIGAGKFWKSVRLNKKYEVYGRQQGELQ